MLPIPRAQNVFFPLKLTAQAETPFPSVDNLIGMNVMVVGFAAYDDSVFGHAPDGAAVVAVADAINLSVVFKRGSDEMFLDIPYTDLIRSVNAGIYYECEPFPINLTECFIRNNAAITGPVDASIVFFYRLNEESRGL